jgi:tetratricopeptide (TPR) repeat protein
MKNHYTPLLFILFFFSFFTHGQQKERLFKASEKLYNNGKYDEALETILTIGIDSLKNQKDSLWQAKYYHLKANILYGLGNYKTTIFDYNHAINVAPSNEQGNNIKGMVLFDRAFSEYNLEQYLTSYETVKKAERFLSNVQKPNLDYLLSIYADLSSSATEFGFFSEAAFYLEKGIELYYKNKATVVVDRYQASKPVLFQYKFIVLFTTQGNEKKILSHLKKLEKLRTEKVFNQVENLMYAVSLNLIGDYYLNFREQMDMKYALSEGKSYLTKALKYLDGKVYPDNEI